MICQQKTRDGSRWEAWAKMKSSDIWRGHECSFRQTWAIRCWSDEHRAHGRPWGAGSPPAKRSQDRNVWLLIALIICLLQEVKSFCAPGSVYRWEWALWGLRVEVEKTILESLCQNSSDWGDDQNVPFTGHSGWDNETHNICHLLLSISFLNATQPKKLYFWQMLIFSQRITPFYVFSGILWDQSASQSTLQANSGEGVGTRWQNGDLILKGLLTPPGIRQWGQCLKAILNAFVANHQWQCFVISLLQNMSKYDVCDDNSEITDYSKIVIKLGASHWQHFSFAFCEKRKALC